MNNREFIANIRKEKTCFSNEDMVDLANYVRSYLTKLETDFSFYIDTTENIKLLEK